MYREQWVADILRDRTILEVALDIHMTTTGSLERACTAQEDDIKALIEVDKTWQDYGPKTILFDDAVRHLIRISIKEAEEEEDQDPKNMGWLALYGGKWWRTYALTKSKTD